MNSSVDSQERSPNYPEPGHDGASGNATEMNVIHHDDRALPHERLATRSFLSLLFVQFLTVLNDHTFRWLVVPIAKPHLGQAGALSLGLAAFTIPFILLATPAGYLADRFSKAWVIRACKTAEIVIMGLGFVALLTGNMTFLITIVAMTGALAALFSPAKSGCVPELVDEPLLSKANGLMAGQMDVEE